MAKDPYKYFRIEARELLDSLSRGVMELEKGVPGKELVGKVLRYAHTLKGASRVVRQPEIGELSHKMEEILAPYREGLSAVPREHITPILALLDTIGARLNALVAPDAGSGVRAAVPTAAAEATNSVQAPIAATPGTGLAERQARPVPHAPVRRATDEHFDTVRVEIKEMDALLEGISRVDLQVGRLRRQIEVAEQAHALAASLAEQLAPRQHGSEHAGGGLKAGMMSEQLRERLEDLRRELGAGVEQAGVELAQVRNTSNELRLLSASSIFGQLERSVRDAAQSQNKKVSFAADGGETRLDAHVLAALRDALLHVVRNAVAHGIEPEGVRLGAGKEPAGRIALHVERRGNRVALICSDDGEGVDVEAVRAVAQVRNLLPQTEIDALNTERAIQLILRGGLTTMRNVTELSGRGVGMDVVRATIEGLKGTLTMTSQRGRGTRIEMCVPVSLSSLAALAVEVNGLIISVPLDAVRETVRLTDADIARSADGLSITHNGGVIPYLPLAQVLQRAGESTRPSLAGTRSKATVALILASAPHLAAVGVNRLRGTSNVVVRPLPAAIDSAPLVAGVFLDAEGTPQLLLDPRGLVEHARTGRQPDLGAATALSKPVLVIDDSLTTRMLEQSILESAGYDVEVACSAEEGLEKARAKQYGLFIVDVEMPGMNGFEFVKLTRGDPVLGKIPAILVTSLNSPEDLARGKQAGAGAYIIKGEFDQKHLLQTIGSLMG